MIFLLVVGAGLLILFGSGVLLASEFQSTSTLDSIFHANANRTRVPFRLGFSIAKHESNLNPRAVNLETAKDRRTGRDSDSLGIFQILYPDTALKLRPGITREQCFEPDLNVSMGFDLLKELLSRYPVTDPEGFPTDAVASYNAGKPRHNATGEYTNQNYVESVREIWRSIE